MKKKFIALLLSVITILSAVSFATADEKNYIGWTYPVVPETLEWLEAWENEDYQEVVSLLQIPEDILYEMSTEELTEVVLSYPFLVNIFLFNSYSEGLESILNDFNGARELVKRDDASQYLLNHYNSVKSQKSTGESDLLQKQIAVFLILTDISENLLSEEIDSIEMDMENMNVYRLTPRIDNVMPYVDGYVKTPEGSNVAYYLESEMTSSQINTLNKITQNDYPKAVFLRSSTAVYNCHSYAWYSTSANNKYWIENPRPYMNDGSYVKSPNASMNNKAYWTNGSHSGIVYTGSNVATLMNITSKWGQGPLMRHKADSASHPYSGSISYWTR